MPHQTAKQDRLRILVVDDEANIRLTVSLCLEAEGHQVETAATIDEALELVENHAYDLIFLDLRLGMQNGMDFLPQLVRQNVWTRIVIITAFASVESAVEAMKKGASDYLPKPFEAAQVIHVTQKIAERRQLERKVEALHAAMGDMAGEADLETADPGMLSVLELARQVAQSQANLVIQGEVGTGKGRLAHAIHAWSNRGNQPFVAVSCRNEPGESMLAELFGTASPAPDTRAAGKVEVCDGGTLALEEVGELPMRLQPLILRLLKDREFERLDDLVQRRVNVRVIATTTIDLAELVERGCFRADLQLALNVVQLNIPPLRCRPNDIPLLAEKYLVHFARLNHRQIMGFTATAMYVLTKHRWPGNVRELRNLVERAVLLCQSDYIDVEHLPSNLNNSNAHVAIGDLVSLSLVEELHIRRVVAASRSLRQAARILGLDSGTIVRRMKRYGVHDDQPAA